MFAFMIGTFLLHAQVGGRTLKKVMELKMPKTADDDMPGTRGASVAWHPLKKQYYASFAGNTEYPHAVSNATGKRLSGDDEPFRKPSVRRFTTADETAGGC